MRTLFAASIVGLILAIPLMAMINFGFGRFEEKAKTMVAVREMMEEVGLANLSDALDAANAEDFDSFAKEAFPIDRSISNYQGKTIEVIITGRTREELQFHSLRYNHDYSYPIQKLAEKDQQFVRGLPLEEVDG